MPTDDDALPAADDNTTPNDIDDNDDDADASSGASLEIPLLLFAPISGAS